MPVKLRDIAEACGLDVSSVSRALRGDERISQDTIGRVRAVARKMGYRANPAAQALVGARTHVVWLILSEMGNLLEQQIAEAASRYLESKGYDLAVVLCHHDADRFSYLLQRLRSNPVDGAMVVPPFSRDLSVADAETAKLEKAGFPLVFVDRYPLRSSCPVVTSRNREGASRIVAELVKEAADHILILDDPQANLVQRDRCEGYIHCAKELGVSFTSGQGAAVPASKERIGLVGSSKASVLRWIREHPDHRDKTFLAGVFDGWSGDSSVFECIYSCRQDFRTMAERAVDILLAQIEGKTPENGRAEIEPISCEKVFPKPAEA